MLKTYFCIIAALVCVCAAHAKDYLENYLPDTTLFSLSLDDFKGLVSELEQGRLSEFVTEKQRAEWTTQLEEPFETGDGQRFTLPSGNALSFDSLDEVLTGRICGAVVGMDEANDMEPEIVLIAEFSGDIEALKFLQICDRDLPSDEVLLVEEPYAGITLYTEELVEAPEEEWMPEYWTLVDGYAIETTSLELLKNTVDSILDTRRDGLGSTEDFLRSMDICGEAQARAYGNLRVGVDMLRSYFQSDMGDIPLNPLGVTLESLWNSLAVDNLHAAFASLDYKSDNLQSTFGVLYDERKGILELLAYSPDPLRLPHWVPEEVAGANVTMIDFSEAFAALESILNDMSPNFGAMFQLQLDNLRQQTGLDLREALLNNFGDQFASFTVWKEDANEGDEKDRENKIFAIPIRDPQAFQGAVKGLAETFMPGAEMFTERPFLDMSIMVPAQVNQEDPPFGYALVDNHLFVAIGSVDLLERTLYRLRESDGGLWNQSYMVDALADMPPNPVECAYFNLGSAMEQVMAIYREEVADNLGKGIELDIPEFSGADMPYFILSAGYILEDAQITRARVLPKNP
ncbi:hypothetical protein [Cerasicoccus maritimus]|uniref:hypothetical protein n=1 Tax=Cerasicoccus maritimus TaxID=490089 RepID=UPI0028525228|nr:hypothetical protein [Cerasicoccus maritimus]